MELQPTEQKYRRPSWDEYFLNITEIAGTRGTCDRFRGGAVIIKDRRMVSMGYAGSPAGLPHCDEAGHEMHTVVNEDGTTSRHCIRTTHAEQNAIVQAARYGISVDGGTLYCKMTPCYTCAKMIINAGITRVVCAKDYHASSRTKEVFAEAGIALKIVNPEINTYADMGKVPSVIAAATPLVLDPNKHVFLYDQFSPEDTAMMQALYSRSPESVQVHAEKVKQSGSGKFMEKFYVGYGHASIADCGSTTLFIEKISILADKAIQDWPLYSGQETSTRYIDMSKQPLVDPIASVESKAIQKAWMDFYIGNMEPVQEHLKRLYPKKSEEDEKIYIKAIQARAFDIMRGFLPAGITTQLSWHTNLRQAWDKLAVMRHHPLAEVKDLAAEMLTNLKEKYPNSFCHELHESAENYRKFCNEAFNYHSPEFAPQFAFKTTIDFYELSHFQEALNRRPPRTGLPQFLAELGHCSFEFLLDFGSFRDLQRHRNGVCRMPLLTQRFGFNGWYLAQLPEEIRFKAETLLTEQKQRIDNLGADETVKQYYIPLGYNVACKVTYGLPATVYVLELRSGKAVHPTLRKIAHQMNNALKAQFPFLTLHADLEKDEWDVRRGLQDIVAK